MSNSSSFKSNYICSKKYRLDFGLSSNPLGPSSRVMHALCTSRELLAPYPEEGYPLLTQKLVSVHHCRSQDIILGAGLDGLIYDLVNLILDKNDEFILPTVTFRNAIYAASNRKAKIIQIPMKPDLSVDFDVLINAITPVTKLIFLCNPNNPTGIYEPIDSIIRVLQSTNALVIVDEANIEYSGGSCLFLTERFTNLLVLRTFSKAYGLAGMRVGYGISRSPLLQDISAKRPPFCIGSISALAAQTALEDQQHLHVSVEYMRYERELMMRELAVLGLRVVPSQSNTLLCRVPASFGTASTFVEALHQVDCHVVNGAFFHLSDPYVRIAPRLHVENVEFISIVKKLIESIPQSV